LPRAQDDLDFSVVSLNYAVNAGLDPKKALLLEGADTNWNLVFVTRTKDKDQSDDPALRRDLPLAGGQGFYTEALWRHHSRHLVIGNDRHPRSIEKLLRRRR